MDEFVFIICVYQEEMIQILESICKDKLENLMFQLKFFELMMLQIEGFFNFIEDLFQRNISEEIMYIKNYVKLCVEEIMSFEVGINLVENEYIGYVFNMEMFEGF